MQYAHFNSIKSDSIFHQPPCVKQSFTIIYYPRKLYLSYKMTFIRKVFTCRIWHVCHRFANTDIKYVQSSVHAKNWKNKQARRDNLWDVIGIRNLTLKFLPSLYVTNSCASLKISFLFCYNQNIYYWHYQCAFLLSETL